MTSDQLSVPWEDDLLERLKDAEYAKGFLEVSLEEYEQDGDLGAFLNSIRHVAQAQGKITNLAKEMGVDRSTVYRALSKDGNPTINTLNAALRNLGFKISVSLAPA